LVGKANKSKKKGGREHSDFSALLDITILLLLQVRVNKLFWVGLLIVTDLLTAFHFYFNWHNSPPTAPTMINKLVATSR
jgi:hypothetical protein